MNMIYENASLAKDAIAVGPVPAPQRAFSEAASERLAGFPGSGWETLYLELAALATAQKDVDPILTGQILQLLLGFAASTSPYEADWVKRYEERISTENLDFVAWLDPYQDSDPARNRVRQLLDSMEPFPEVVDGVKKKLAAMEQSLKPCQPAGVLLGESERVRFAEPPADGTLLVIWGKPGQEPAFEEIGKVEKGQTVVRDGMTAPFPDGTPVFLRAKAAQETDKAE